MTLDLNLGSSFDVAAFSTNSAFGGEGYDAGSLRVTQDTGQLVKLSNVRSPLDKQSTIKIANTRIANVYNTLAKGSIPLGAQALNTSGQTIFCEMTAIASKASGTILLPMVGRIELRLPNDGELTDEILKAFVFATIAGLTDASNNLRVTEAMRGILFHGS